MKNYHFVASSALVLSASAFAQIAVDGTAEAAYGLAAVVQSVGTGFGNGTDGLKGTCNGSELDGAFASLDATGGYLYLTFAGNMESNFNKFELFIDCKAVAGQNQLRSDNVDVDFNGLNRMGADAVNALPGLKFDAGFDADFYFTCTGGNNPYTLYANFAQVLTKGGPNKATEVLVYTLYAEGFEFFRSGYASAVTVVFLAIVLLITVVKTRWLDRRVHYA